MTHYIATFHTHLAALRTYRSLCEQGIEARMAPVPRRISSSCGTCVLFCAQQPCISLMDEDAEAIYAAECAEPVWQQE